jgi:hypothetical protein
MTNAFEDAKAAEEAAKVQPELETDESASTTDANIEDQELDIDDFEQKSYLKTPGVGDSIEFTIKGMREVKDPSKHFANAADGDKFCTGVQRNDGKVIKIEIDTEDGKIFVLNSWTVFYLFRGSKSTFATYVREKGSFKGVKVKLTRNYNGKVPKQAVKEVMKLYDFDTEEKAVAYQKEVTKAKEDGKLITLEIIK